MRANFKRFGTVVLVCVFSQLHSQSAEAQAHYWLQYVPGGEEIRAITAATQCPPARIDGVDTPMAVRSAPNAAYPVTVCSLPIPPAAVVVTIRGVPLPLLRSEPKRIAIIGDTGCRLKDSYIQACNDPQQWPFRLIAEVLAQQKPDLVIHVGDYHYRETPCPAGIRGCAGSPFGDIWDVWREDFFGPAETLLKTAPWVFVRGNHEECDRGGQGWSRTIDPYPFDASHECNGIGKPFLVRLGGLSLAVVDVASAREERVDEGQAELYRQQYQELSTQVTGPTWLLQHRPIWSAGGVIGGIPLGHNKTLARAVHASMPEQVSLMLSGHHHLFQALNYRSDLPPQIIVGHGGDYLNRGPLPDPAGWTFDGVAVESGLNAPGSFGFVVLDKMEAGWDLTNHDRFGKVVGECKISGRRVACLSQ